MADEQTTRPMLHFAQVKGDTIGERCKEVRLTPLHRLGDFRLVWVSEGDLLLMQMQGQAKDCTSE